MIEGRCHCGAVGVRLAQAPTEAAECNCSLCSRLGTLWAYFPIADLQILAAEGAQEGYIQGDRTLTTWRCAGCGCVTHWTPLPAFDRGRVGVNVRLLERSVWTALPRRLIDGASF